MSLNLNTDLALINTTNNSGSITLPSASSIPGRVITFKDNVGIFTKNNFTLVCSGSDTFEDGTTSKVFNESFGFIQLVASGTKWYILCGVKQNTMTLSSLNVSSISTYTIQFRDGSIQTISADKNINSSIIGLGNIGYISSSQLTSSVTGLGNIYISSFNTISSLNISSGNIIVNQAFLTSTITSNIAVSINPQSTINVGNSFIPAYSTNRISTISLGTTTNRWFQTFAVSTITSSITADLASIQTVSTQNIIGFNLLGTTILSTQQIFCSSIQIGPQDAILDVVGPIRAQDMSTLTLQASTITAGTMTLDKLFGGPIATATTTGNIYPFSAGAQVGFGSNTAQGGTYAEGHFRSTFTQVIQPTLDNDGFSNIVKINGSISTGNIFVSSIFGTMLSTNTIITTFINGPTGGGAYTSGNIYPAGVNILGFGTGGPGNGPWDSASIRQTNTSSINTNYISTGNIFVSTIVANTIGVNFISTGSFNISSFNANSISAGTLIFSTLSFQNISAGTGFISSLNVNSLTFGAGTGYADFTAIRAGLVSSIQADTGAQKLSSLNLKLPPFWSTLNIPTSSFTISGSAAGTPVVLYSNVQFPPYTKGLYKIYQKAILSKTAGATSLVVRGNIFYTQGTFPSSTTLFHDGYSGLPYVDNTGASTFTTCVTMVSISSITTRNICFYDSVANAYTANLYLGNLAVEYVPSLGFAPDIGQNIL